MPPVRVYEIETASGADLNDLQICFETVTDTDLGYKMFATKDGASTVLRHLAKDQNARVLGLSATSIGIGVSPPAELLEIKSATENPTISLYADHATDYDPTIIFKSNLGAVYYSLGVDSGDGYKFKISSDSSLGGTNDFVMDNKGFVGLGEDTPDALLEISDIDNHPVLMITAKHATDYDPQLQFRSDASPTVKASIGTDSGDSDKFKIAMGTGGVGGSSDFVMDQNGKFGIGDSSPAYKVVVSENDDTDFAVQIKNIHATGSGLLLDGGGTTEPAIRVRDHDGANELLKVLGNGELYAENLRYELDPTGTDEVRYVVATGEIIRAQFS